MGVEEASAPQMSDQIESDTIRLGSELISRISDQIRSQSDWIRSERIGFEYYSDRSEYFWSYPQLQYIR
jgi:hypothetical protein